MMFSRLRKGDRQAPQTPIVPQSKTIKYFITPSIARSPLPQLLR
ncbi:MAG: hypothetical protein AAGD25_31995 [Cyanobacteria bacterium P01_F01_bin.150]